MIVMLTMAMDILSTAFLFYLFYRFFKGTHTAAVAKGLMALMVVYLVALRFNLSTLTWIFDRLIANFPILLAIIFQQELRRLFATIGAPRGKLQKGEDFLKKLAETLIFMSKNKVGALIVIEDLTRLDEIISNGVVLDADFSQELMLTIFHKGTDLHDGAVVIRGEKIYAAQVFLPVDYTNTVTRRGTRHEAGTVFTRDRGCTTLIVSEESGDFSYARNNVLVTVPRRKIEEVLNELLA